MSETDLDVDNTNLNVLADGELPAAGTYRGVAGYINTGTLSFWDSNNVNNVLVGQGSCFNETKLVKDCTIIGANCFIDTGDNVAIIGNNIKLLNTDIAYTKDAIFLGNTKQKLYLCDNNSYIYNRFDQLCKRINSLYEELERPDRSLFIPVNNQ
ncbi:MAG: hypothetical protein WD512_03795, partial [Candidatus Paceibacterota bacterium]